LGNTVLFSTPLRFKDSEPPPPQSVAGLGAHSAEVLAEFLNLSAPEVDKLRAAGTI
jgi:crotonobetainyl-CoA:carnitine CoA-transferase CaiB-like acyl-CoA transferase